MSSGKIIILVSDQAKNVSDAARRRGCLTLLIAKETYISHFSIDDCIKLKRFTPRYSKATPQLWEIISEEV